MSLLATLGFIPTFVDSWHARLKPIPTRDGQRMAEIRRVLTITCPTLLYPSPCPTRHRLLRFLHPRPAGLRFRHSNRDFRMST